MNETVLISCVQIQRDLERHRHRLDARNASLIVPPVAQKLSERELLDLILNVDGMIAGDDELTRDVLAHAPRLRIISKWGIGTDSIDLTAAEDLGIRVTNTPGQFGDEVADVVLGYLILLARQLHVVDRDVRAGLWTKPLGVSLRGRTMGVVGLGDIGTEVCRRALSTGMHVLGADISSKAAEHASSIGVEITDFEDLTRRSDVVSLNCPLTPSTRHMVDEARMRGMKPGAWIINTARGSLIDEQALIANLESGQIGQAALDVFEIEPLPATSPLRHMPQVVLGSHNSSNTQEAGRRTSDRAVANLLSGLDEVRR